MHPQAPTQRYERPKGLVLLGVICTWLLSTTANSAWQAPLSENEKNAAESATLLHQSSSITTRRSIVTEPDHPLGIQTLLVEPREQKKGRTIKQPMAEVFTFNHHTHSAHRTLVNLTSNAVISSEPIASVHLPLSDAEIDFSIQATRNDVQFQTRLYEEHVSLGHKNNQDAMTGLQLRVSIWVPTTPTQANQSGCDLERCALISLFDANNVSYSVEPIVNLKTRTVHLDIIR